MKMDSSMDFEMAQRRVVNVVPHIKIKKEIPSDDEDEDCATCRICNKSFASEVALRNHARMEHVEAYLTGDKDMWTLNEQKEPPFDVCQSLIKQKTEQIISSMAPADLISLASEDVSYIIVKAEDHVPITPRKRKAEKQKETEKVPAPRREKEREVQPITGPFECLQPSVLVADGTCHQIFFSCCEYSVHFRDEHTRRRKGLRCQVCEKPLAGGDDQAPFSCEVCGAGFTSNKDLSNHMATDHVKLKPFECNVCHKRFTQQGGVQQHMRMHTGDRPFSCTFCPKAFTQKSGLDQHLRIHTKVKPYRCVICSKTFCQSVHLRQHMRTHTQVSPFQCGICQKRFKQSSHLNYHLKNHNQLNMTDQQKTAYHKLMTMISTDNRQADSAAMMSVVTVTEEGEGEVEVEAEVEGDGDGEVEEEIEQEEVEAMDEDEVLMDEQEQILAEQSIQVEEEDGETYILSDVVHEM